MSTFLFTLGRSRDPWQVVGVGIDADTALDHNDSTTEKVLVR